MCYWFKHTDLACNVFDLLHESMRIIRWIIFAPQRSEMQHLLKMYVRLSVRHTREWRLNDSRYRNIIIFIHQ